MNAKLKIWWGLQSARINALSLRERIFLFVSVIACCLALADVLWLSPAQMLHKQLKQRFEKQSGDLQRAREALKANAKPVKVGATVGEQIAAIKVQLDAVNQNIKDVSPVTEQATPLTDVLVHFLSRHEGLTLVRITVEAPDGASVKPAAAGSAPALTPTAALTRQGVELTVSGPYPELVNYVQTLEKSLPHVHWGSMTLKSEKLPPELTLQLFLLGAPS